MVIAGVSAVLVEVVIVPSGSAIVEGRVEVGGLATVSTGVDVSNDSS